jgi:hypothetical protein
MCNSVFNAINCNHLQMADAERVGVWTVGLIYIWELYS